MCNSATLSAPSQDTPPKERRHLQFDDTDFCVEEDFVDADLLSTLRGLLVSPASAYLQTRLRVLRRLSGGEQR